MGSTSWIPSAPPRSVPIRANPKAELDWGRWTQTEAKSAGVHWTKVSCLSIEFLFEFLFAGHNSLTGACGIANHCTMHIITVRMCMIQPTQLPFQRAVKLTTHYGQLVLIGSELICWMTAECMRRQPLGTRSPTPWTITQLQLPSQLDTTILEDLWFTRSRSITHSTTSLGIARTQILYAAQTRSSFHQLFWTKSPISLRSQSFDKCPLINITVTSFWALNYLVQHW